MAEIRDLARAWQAVLGKLELELPPATFKTFLQGTRALRLEGETLVVEANRLNVDEVNGRLSTVIERYTYYTLDQELRVVFVPRGSTEAGGDGQGRVSRAGGDFGDDAAGQLLGTVNRLFTFARYLPAEGNRIALECCRDLLSDRAFTISPIVVYGRPGLGKTHLLHALAREAAEAGWSVACLSAEEFTTSFTRSVRDKAGDEFRDTFRGVRLLILDELQDLVGRTGTQDELVHTINAIGNRGGRVVMASEQDPLELNLNERLASRLSAGIATRILPFDVEERRRYVELVARDNGAALPAWAVDRIVGIEAPSVRVLQGAVNAAIALERCRMLDLQRLDAQLTRIAVLEATTGSFAERDLLEAVARHFELCYEDLTGESRKKSVTAARAVAAAALQERGKSLSQIGSVLGRHRGTIDGLAQRGRKLLEAEPALRARLAG